MTTLSDRPKPFTQAGDVSARRMIDDLEDYGLMETWLTDERVLRFYEGRDRPYDIEMVAEKHGERARGGRIVPCILQYRGDPVGYLQHYPLGQEDRAEYQIDSVEGVHSIDMFIGQPELWNQGLGTRFVHLILRYLFIELSARRVVIEPQVSNRRAIRCYEKAGFSKVTRLPRHLMHEGKMRTCWLMIADPVHTAPPLKPSQPRK